MCTCVVFLCAFFIVFGEMATKARGSLYLDCLESFGLDRFDVLRGVVEGQMEKKHHLDMHHIGTAPPIREQLPGTPGSLVQSARQRAGSRTRAVLPAVACPSSITVPATLSHADY